MAPSRWPPSPSAPSGDRWNALSALLTLAVVAAVVAGLRALLTRGVRTGPGAAGGPDWPVIIAGAELLFSALAIGFAAWRGMPYWQSIPVPGTRSGAPTPSVGSWTPVRPRRHMGELRNVETQAALYYPSAFHALAAVLAQLTGAAPTTAYTLSSLAAAVWLFPLSAALLTWQLLIQPDSHPLAHSRRGGHQRRALGILHRGALRRVRHRLDAEHD